MLVFACVSLASGALDDPLPDLPSFGTIAGDGTDGFRDAGVDRASFMAPAAVVYERSGDLIVVDRAAQRIRRVSRSGQVTTIAGSGNAVALGIGVPGGFRDGPAHEALFNAPQGAAVLPDGSILVADTYNYCLRRIANGVVSTFAGNHLVSARVDGALSVARFVLPRALSVDRAGTIYVADGGSGVRVIDTKRRVSTLNFPDSAAVTSLSVAPDNPNVLLVATAERIEWIDLKTNTVSAMYNLRDDYTSSGRSIVGAHTVGPVSSLVAIDQYDFVYTDPLFGVIRFGQRFGGETYERVLSAIPDENSPYGGGSYRDGPGATAKFDEPMGIALGRGGAIAIADTGNRRIRSMSRFDRRTHISALASQAEIPAQRNPSEYRIALVGDSYVWVDQAWHDSLAGLTQDEVQRDVPDLPRKVHIYPIMRFGLANASALSLIENELAFGNVDMVILDLTTFGHIVDDNAPGVYFPKGFDSALTAGLKHTAATLGAAHTAFLVVDHPGANDMPDELAYLHIPKGLPGEVHDYAQYRDPYAIALYHNLIETAVRSAHVPSLDLWPGFLRLYGDPNRKPLFNTWDHHLTSFGRAAVASALAKAIEPTVRVADRR